MAAFISLYHQLPGLYGPDGILPVDLLNQPSKTSFIESPDIIVFLKQLGYTDYESLELICLTGILLSFSLAFFAPKRTTRVFTFIALYLLYLQCRRKGQTFLSFQWDIMLLEFGVICIVLVLAPFQGLLLGRWLLIRLMFHSGYKKLESGCPTWWGLTALNYHFESQCIPTSLAYYAHQMPDLALKSGVAVTFIAQIGMIPFAFSPSRRLRILVGWTHILHQIGIAATGNYTFFNWLTIVLCVTCFDDQHIGYLAPIYSSKKVKSRVRSPEILSRLLELTQLVGFGYLLSLSFSLDINTGEIDLLETAEDQTKLLWIRDHFVKPAIFLSIIWLTYSVFKDIMISIKSAIAVPLSFLILTSSFIPFTDMDRQTQQLIEPFARKAYYLSGQFEITSSYGLFRRMTGVGGRPEVVIELAGSDGEFKELDFLYKPTDLKGDLPWVAPHQPRLDWQMWFAALGNINHNNWLVNFVIRIMQQKESVLNLIDREQYTAKFTKKPIYFRMWLYDYHYTSDRADGIWRRDNKRAYLQARGLFYIVFCILPFVQIL